MRLGKILLICHLLAFLSVSVGAQTNGFWYQAALETSWKKFDFKADVEYRSQGFQYFDRLGAGISMQYKLPKNFGLGAGYELIEVYDDKYSDYQLRNRIYAQASWRTDFGRFRLKIKEKFRVSYKDDSDRLEPDGSIDHYKFNPESTWINSAGLEYNIRKSSFTPWVEVQAFVPMNQAANKQVENWRSSLGLNYKFSKKLSMGIYGMYNSKAQTEDSNGKWIGGINLKYQLK